MKTEETCERLVLVAMMGVMLVVGLYEIQAPFGAGHVAVLPARAMIADNMLEYGIAYPVREITLGAPPIERAYAHHPFGTYFLFAVLRGLFGRGEWVIRLLPVLVSTVMPLLCFGVARQLWGKSAGLLAAVGWVVLPIALAFAQFPSFEMFSAAAWLWLTWAALRYRRSGSRRAAAAVVLCLVVSLHTDWIAALYAGMVMVWLTLDMAFSSKEGWRVAHYRTFLVLVLAAAAVFAVSFGGYLVFFERAGLLWDWLSSARARARDNELPLSQVLLARRFWVELMFTKLGLGLGVLGAIVFAVRVFWLRRMTELLPLGMLLVAAFHYFTFKNGADVHIYWPLPFAVSFALGLGALGASLGELGRRFAPGRTGLCRALAAVPAAFAALMLPDALRALDYARDTGCRLNDDGHLNLQDYDKTLALESFSRRIPRDARVGLHTSMLPNWSQDYALARPTIVTGQIGFVRTDHLIFDTRLAPDSAFEWAAGVGALVVIGPYVLAERNSSLSPLTAFDFVERAPSLYQRLLVQDHDPLREIAADPFLAWELRMHLGQLSDEVLASPSSPEQHRVYCNWLFSRGRTIEHAQCRHELLRGFDRGTRTEYERGVTLLGHRVEPGTPMRLRLLFEAGESLSPGMRFVVSSRVTEPPGMSWVMRDDKTKRVSTGFVIPPGRFMPGFVYSMLVEVRPRPGREVYFGSWIEPGLRLRSGGFAQPILLLERG